MSSGRETEAGRHERTTVADVTEPERTSIGAEATVASALERFRELDVPALPVLDGGGRAIGLVIRRRLAKLGESERASHVGDVAVEAIAEPGDSLAEALARMNELEVDRLAVVQSGRLVGIARRAAARRALEAKTFATPRRLAEIFAGDAVHLTPVEEISPRDDMLARSSDWYRRAGHQALHCIALALAVTGRALPRRVLDLPSGYGRVLRMLKVAYPDAEIVACDIERDAVEFCAETFGATPVVSADDPERIEIEGSFDLIWCGSLLTHLDAARAVRFLARFESLLSADGLLVLTLHGSHFRRRLARRKLTMGLTEPAIDTLLEQYEREGFGYADYPGQSGYGISLASPAWAGARAGEAGLELATFTARMWLGHDVYAWTKRRAV